MELSSVLTVKVTNRAHAFYYTLCVCVVSVTVSIHLLTMKALLTLHFIQCFNTTGLNVTNAQENELQLIFSRLSLLLVSEMTMSHDRGRLVVPDTLMLLPQICRTSPVLVFSPQILFSSAWLQAAACNFCQCCC